MKNLVSKYNIILASQSPRRQKLLKEIVPEFEIRTKDYDESFDADIPALEVAPYLSVIKAKAFRPDLTDNDLLITADTTVVLNDEVINKPAGRREAIEMISKLAGNMHTVVSGVSVSTTSRIETFSSHTKVYFDEISQYEIEHYVDRYEPYDKAGSYGIQEWIGYIGINKIEGCYYNVMGLPLNALYKELKTF